MLVAASLAIHAIGRGYAPLTDGSSKHGIKQFNRLLGNDKIPLVIFPAWVRFVLGAYKKVLLALDGTDFDKDAQSTLSLCVIARPGGATPLLWKTVNKGELKDQRTSHERSLLALLHHLVADDVELTLLANRSFGDHDLYVFLKALGWDYVIRFWGNVKVRVGNESQPAAVFVYAKGMKESWHLATSRNSTVGASRSRRRSATRFSGRRGERWLVDEGKGKAVAAGDLAEQDLVASARVGRSTRPTSCSVRSGARPRRAVPTRYSPGARR